MSIVDAICQMGDHRHRERVRLFYAARRLKDEGLSLAEIAKSLDVTSRKVCCTLSGIHRNRRSLFKETAEAKGYASRGRTCHTGMHRIPKDVACRG